MKHERLLTLLFGHALSWLMPVMPGMVSHKMIRYTISAPSHKVVYVTRTANLWPRPPVSARFILSHGMRLNYSHDGKLEIEYRNYKPDDNWAVTWP